MIRLCCVCGYVHVWMGPGVFLFVSILCISTPWLEACLSPRLGAPESRSDRRGEVRLEESAHPFPKGGLGEGCGAPGLACPC